MVTFFWPGSKFWRNLDCDSPEPFQTKVYAKHWPSWSWSLGEAGSRTCSPIQIPVHRDLHRCWRVVYTFAVTLLLYCIDSCKGVCSAGDGPCPTLLNVFMSRWQSFSAFTAPPTEAVILDVLSFYMCSSLHQKRRKPQEVAACISRKRNYIISSPLGTAQKGPMRASTSLMRALIRGRSVLILSLCQWQPREDSLFRLTGKLAVWFFVFWSSANISAVCVEGGQF